MKTAVIEITIEYPDEYQHPKDWDWDGIFSEGDSDYRDEEWGYVSVRDRTMFVSPK